MKFISETPESRYVSISYNGILFFIDGNDFNDETIKQVQSFCHKHGYDQIGVKPKAIYYLRGSLKQVEYSLVLKGLQEVDVLPFELNEIIHCLTFWNQEGMDCFKMNGEAHESYQDFILKCIAADCRTFVSPSPDRFITGRGGNHVWVSHKVTAERIFMIHF